MQVQQQEHRAGYIAVIGRPNAGKSTLIDKLIGEKAAIVSDRPQTTRNRILCILSTEKAQLIFLDTPGLHKPKDKLGEHMVKAAEDSLKDVDAVLYVVDATEKRGKGEAYILERFRSRSSLSLTRWISSTRKKTFCRVLTLFKRPIPSTAS